jgi:hypothetical protein
MAIIINGSTGITNTDGTVSAPSVSGTDSNTGMFFPAADTIAFAENGVESMRLNSDGQLVTSAGSASLPAITTSGDPNTGIFFPAADTMAFAEGGTEVMRINSSSNVGIGTTSPTQKLDVSGNIAFSGNGRRIIGDFSASTQTNRLIFQSSVTDGFTNVGAAPNGTGTGSALRFYSTSDPDNSSVATIISGGGTNTVSLQSAITGTGTYIPMTFFTSGSERMRIETGGEVYIAGTTDRGAFNLQCNGTGVWGAGAYTNGSDARIKEDVSPITSGLDVIQKMNPVQFRYTEEWSKDRSMQPGFIAQELQDALSGEDYVEGVVSSGPEYLSVAYQTIIPLLVKAVQEQQTQIDELKARIEALEGK